MELLLADQKKGAEDMSKILTNYKKDSNDRKTIEYVKERINRINIIWQLFHRTNDKLETMRDEKQPYFTQNTYLETQRVYMEISTMLTQKLWLLEEEQKSKTSKKDEQTNRQIETEQAKMKNALAISEIHLTDLLENIENMQLTAKSLGTLELTSEELKGQFNEWKKRFIDTQHFDTDGYDRQTYDRHHNNYVRLCGKIQDAIISAKNVSSGGASNMRTTADLPKIKIPDFDGNVSTWKTFYELYEQVVHQNASLGNAAKMHFLKTYVKGEAARLINHLAPTADNYEGAYKILIARYENTRILLGKLLDTLLELPQLNKESCKQLKTMHDTIFECLMGIENLNVKTENWDSLLTHILAKKLDGETRKSYECQLQNPKEPQQINNFLKFIEARFMALETYGEKDAEFIKTISVYAKGQKKGQQPSCSFCSGQHTTSKCEKFEKLNEQERVNIAREKKWCMNCLRMNHKTSECKCKYTCDKCNKNHNTLLHLDIYKKFEKDNSAKSKTVSNTSNIATTSRQTVQSMTSNNNNNVLLATAVINVHAIHGTPIMLRALIDQGSQSAYITENAAQMLSLPRTRISATITGIGNHTRHANHSVQMTITPRTASSFILQANAIVLEKLSSNSDIDYEQKQWSHIAGLQLADPSFYEKNQIDILLGAAEYAKIIKSGLIKGEEGMPIAQNTELGWIVSGRFNRCSNENGISIRTMVSTTEIDELIKKFWEINEIQGAPQHTTREQECEKMYVETHQRLQNGRYMVKLPFKNNEIDLGKTRSMAVATFLQLERKFERNREYFQQYKAFIEEYINLGHMIETNDEAEFIYYLPHHAVFKESTTTKMRVVFDASRKSDNGKSLNDNLMIGPTMQQDMISVIMRWRKHRIVFTADVEKMYRQILVHNDHTNLQRIIWRNSPKEKLRDFKLLTVTYGTACAPYLAIRTLQQLAHDEYKNHPEAAEIMLKDFYVDDVITGADDVDAAKFLQAELKQTMECGGMNLRKWSSNSGELLEGIPENERETPMQHEFMIDAAATIKTLGIKWRPSTDTFEFKINVEKYETATKRELLSEIASLYDPLGWLAPMTIKAKILIQETWSAGIAWDDKLPNEIKTIWIRMKNELPCIEQIKIPRWIGAGAHTKVQLHGFCDASESAYAAVIYMRTIDATNGVNVSLLTAKTKVAPLKKEKLTIPRLELCGATLLAKLAQQVIQSMEIDIDEVCLWSDSKVVIAWIKGNPNRWKTFVANRAIEINGKFKSNVWNYVQSKQNPADCASRGIFPGELNDFKLWWHGPQWLWDDNEEIKYSIDEIETTLEQKIVTTNNAIVQTSVLPVKTSFHKLRSVIAWCLRFKENCKNKKPCGDPITMEEYHKATNAIMFAVQHECFTDEITVLQRNEKLRRSSAIIKLNPFVDANGLLRVGGRLNNSELNIDAKHQLLIPYEHFVTDLIIKKAHFDCMHGGSMLTESTVRQQFWIPKGYKRIKAIIHNCGICRRYSNSRMQQFMGNLPKARVTGIRAFMNCGVDYAGPIAVRTTRGRGHTSVKGYIAVFICMATKAIHLECVSDMTAETFIAAYKRFAARRGPAANMYSDNGGNFTKGNKLLQLKSKQEEDAYNNTVYTEMIKVNTQWHFNPPESPNFGGLWEAGVKSVKTHLKKTVGEAKLTFEELSTLLYQIEATLNSRPLCPLSSEPNDVAVLTPGHFLIGAPLLAPPEISYLEVNTNRLSRWQLIQKMHQHFWKRWSGEYLNRLQSRPKWLEKIDELKINDLVLLKEDNLPPARWATGRIIAKHPGQDGLTRVVDVQINDKIYRRSLSKICSLPAENEDIATEESITTKKINTNLAVVKQSQRRGKTPFFTMAMILAIVIIMTQPIKTLNSIEISQFEHHPGIYFENQGVAYLSYIRWNIITYYDLKIYVREMADIRTAIKTMWITCNEMKNDGCRGYMDQLDQNFEEIRDRNEIILTSGQSRRKRATLNFVGNILGDVFGVLGEKFENEYSKDLGKIKNNEEHLQMLIKNHTTIAETTLNVLKRDEDELALQSQHISNLMEEMHNTTDERIRMDKFTNMAMRLLIALTKYESKQNNILNVLLDVHNRVVNTNIITPQQLRLQIQKIHSNVDSSILIPGEDAHNELKALYNIMHIQAMTSNEQIIFKLTVPLITNERFQIFKLIAIPTRRENNLIWVEPSTPYLLTTLRRNLYYAMTEGEKERCEHYGTNAIICERKGQLYDSTNSKLACEINLLNHNKNLPGRCKFQTSKMEDIWIPLSASNKWIFAIYNEFQMDVICNNQVDRQTIQGEGILTLPPECTIHHGSIEITAQNIFETAILESILPEINISNAIDTYTQKKGKNITLYKKSDVKTLDEMIQHVQMQEELPETLSTHDIHQYGLGYMLLAIMAAYFIWRYRSYRHRQNINMNRPTIIRAISMPSLRRENVHV